MLLWAERALMAGRLHAGGGAPWSGLQEVRECGTLIGRAIHH
jgi:hypothetical protein